jgi:hypothetical protein
MSQIKTYLLSFFSIFAIQSLVLLTCSQRNELFTKPNNIAHCYAFACDTTLSVISNIADTIHFVTIDTIHTTDSVTLVGIIYPLSENIGKSSWSINDGTTSDKNIYRKKFETGGVFNAVFTVEDNAGLTMSDTVVVCVNTPPVAGNLISPVNGDRAVDPKDRRGIRFQWKMSDVDKNPVRARLYISSDSGFLQPSVTDIDTDYFDYAGDLKVHTRYYWRIVVEDTYRDADTSVIYSFTTKDPGTSGGLLRGYAFYQGKRNHAGIKISLSAAEALQRSAVTNDSGFFQITNIDPRPIYTIIATDTIKSQFASDTTYDTIFAGVLTLSDTLLLKDLSVPVITENLPVTTQTIRKPGISAKFSDKGSGIVASSAAIFFNDSNITEAATITNSGFQWVPANRLSDGSYKITVCVKDSAGNFSDTLKWYLSIDALKLTILIPDTTIRINDSVQIHSHVLDVYSMVSNYKWDFDGDGIWDDSLSTSDTLVARSHFYSHEADYNAIVYVRDDNGKVKLDTVIIKVGNTAPVINSIRKDTTISINDSIQLFGVAVDNDGTIKEYAWDFMGDGIFEFTSTTKIQSGFRYTADGVHSAVFKVTDDHGKTSSSTATITVLKDVPVPNAGNDTVVSIKDTIRLHGSVSQLFGTIVEWAWDFGNTGTFTVMSNGDTSIIAPSTQDLSYLCVLRVTDDDGNVAKDTMKVAAMQDVPVISFISKDTVVEHGGSVRCSVCVSQQYGSMKVEIDTANSGIFKILGNLNLSGGNSYTFSTGTASSWDSVKIRVTDDDGNIVMRGQKVDILPAALTITSIDSTVNTVAVNYNQTQEVDFAEYRIYRNTTSVVDTNCELWGTVTTASTVRKTIASPNYNWEPRYYRVYQRDSEGLMSAGSNVVYGNIINTSPTTPVIRYPLDEGDSIDLTYPLRWTKSTDINGQTVKYRILIDLSNSGYVQLVADLADTAFPLQNFTLLNSMKINIIAYDSDGDSCDLSPERTFFIKNIFPPNTTIKAVAIDNHSNKWFGTTIGLYKFDGTSWSVYTNVNGQVVHSMYSLAFDKTNNLWFRTNSPAPNRLFKFDGSQWTVYTPEGNFSDIVHAIAIDAENNKWFGMQGGASMFNGATWTSIPSLSGLSVYSIAVDALGNRWFGTNDGVWVCDVTNLWKHYTSDDGMEGGNVNAIAIDAHGNKWFGTGGGPAKAGVSQFDGTNWTNYTSTTSGLSTMSVFSIAIDGLNNKWFGTKNGLYKFDGTTWTNFLVSNLLADNSINQINSIKIDGQGNVWCGTNNGVTKFDGVNWTIYR